MKQQKIVHSKFQVVTDIEKNNVKIQTVKSIFVHKMYMNYFIFYRYKKIYIYIKYCKYFISSWMSFQTNKTLLLILVLNDYFKVFFYPFLFKKINIGSFKLKLSVKFSNTGPNLRVNSSLTRCPCFVPQLIKVNNLLGSISSSCSKF